MTEVVMQTLPSRDTLHELARRVERLSPSHRTPFRFHEEKSEIVAELRCLADALRERAR